MTIRAAHRATPGWFTLTWPRPPPWCAPCLPPRPALTKQGRPVSLWPPAHRQPAVSCPPCPFARPGVKPAAVRPRCTAYAPTSASAEDGAMRKSRVTFLIAVVLLSLFGIFQTLQAELRARDPGVRAGSPGAGGPLAGLTADEAEMFRVGQEDFESEEGVDEGLGPRFNFVACAGCHSQPAVGGTSPAQNPLFRVTGDLGFTANKIPSFITPTGPIREARLQFKPDRTRDGGVANLFVITGHPDAKGCNLEQPDFAKEIRDRNIIFRIPTPTFGAGLIEQIADATLVANLSANSSTKAGLGISGRLNRNANDGMVSRFGWKAQNQ